MKVRLGWVTFDFFLENKNFFCHFCWVRIERHFPLMSPFTYILKILFSFLAVSLTFLTTENRDVSSAID